MEATNLCETFIASKRAIIFTALKFGVSGEKKQGSFRDLFRGVSCFFR
jgi:hypothetical protein